MRTVVQKPCSASFCKACKRFVRRWCARFELARQLAVDTGDRHLHAGQPGVHGLHVFVVSHKVRTRENDIRVGIKFEYLEQFSVTR